MVVSRLRQTLILDEQTLAATLEASKRQRTHPIVGEPSREFCNHPAHISRSNHTALLDIFQAMSLPGTVFVWHSSVDVAVPEVFVGNSVAIIENLK